MESRKNKGMLSSWRKFVVDLKGGKWTGVLVWRVLGLLALVIVFTVCQIAVMINGQLPRLDFYMFFVCITVLNWGIYWGLLSTAIVFMMRNWGLEPFQWMQLDIWMSLLYDVTLVILIGGKLSLLKAELQGRRERNQELEEDLLDYRQELLEISQDQKKLGEYIRHYQGGVAVWLQRMASWRRLEREELKEQIRLYVQDYFKDLEPVVDVVEERQSGLVEDSEGYLIYMGERPWLRVVFKEEADSLAALDRHQLSLIQLIVHDWSERI